VTTNVLPKIVGLQQWIRHLIYSTLSSFPMRTAEPHGMFRSRDAAGDAQLQDEGSRQEVDARSKAALVPPVPKVFWKRNSWCNPFGRPWGMAVKNNCQRDDKTIVTHTHRTQSIYAFEANKSGESCLAREPHDTREKSVIGYNYRDCVHHH
jgi:hypothetical protein